MGLVPTNFLEKWTFEFFIILSLVVLMWDELSETQDFTGRDLVGSLFLAFLLTSFGVQKGLVPDTMPDLKKF